MRGLDHVMTDNLLVIRPFLREEWPLYRDLRLRALQDAPDAFGSTFAAERDRTDDEWAERLARGAGSPDELPLVAEFNGEPGGLAWVRLEESEPDVAHLYQMWVAPSCRRRGVGRALLDASTAWARAMGAHQLELDVTCSNDAAVRLYGGAGFELYGERRPLRAGATLDAQAMRRAL